MILGWLYLLIGQIFGNTVVPIGTKVTLPFIGPLLFVFLRFLVATLILYGIYVVSNKKQIKPDQYKGFITLGFLLTLNVVLFTLAISYTTVIVSTLIYSLTPICVGIGGYLFLKEPLDKKKIAGLVISFAGMLFLLDQSFVGTQKNAFGEPIGNILIFIAMFGFSYYLILSRKILYMNEQTPIQTTFLTFLFTTLIIFLILLIAVIAGEEPLKPLPSNGIFGFIIVGVGTVLQYLFLQIGIKRTSAFTASLYQYIGPFLAASITIPFLHEQVTSKLALGGIFILVGVFIGTTYDQLERNKH